ncbi:MAG: hypothetical protein RL186_733 [Pseudomonadota bacterium]
MTKPFILPLQWCAPADALAALGGRAGSLGFIGGGPHELARWSCVMDAPVRIHQWRGDRDATPAFAGLQATLDHLQLMPDPDCGPFQGGWAGLLSYELGGAFEAVPRPPAQGQNWPDIWLGLYDTVAVFDSHLQRAFIVSWGLNTDLQADPTRAQTKALGFAARLRGPLPPPARGRGNDLTPVLARPLAEAAIARAVNYIKAGDVFQANISLSFQGLLAGDDTPLHLFSRLVARHPSPFATFLSLGDCAVVSHSPERFLSRTAGGQLETRPIKGTAARDPDPVKDCAQAARLAASEKDRAENLMIVDLMRNDLARVCVPGSVHVPRLCALESFSTVHHLVSDVIGQQREGSGFFDALAASFPPGSITGAPKVRAMEIIWELEQQARGPWCGSMIRVGFDGSAESNVLIRTAACVRDATSQAWHITARAGAGIVADSDPAQEYEEMLMKVRALRVAARNEPKGRS